MAALTPVTRSANFSSGEITFSASDTFVYTPGKNMELRIRNVTAGALTGTFTGSGAASKTYSPDGGTVNYAAGYSTGSITATTGDITLDLDQLQAYLPGTVTITGLTSAKGVLLTD